MVLSDGSWHCGMEDCEICGPLPSGRTTLTKYGKNDIMSNNKFSGPIEGKDHYLLYNVYSGTMGFFEKESDATTEAGQKALIKGYDNNTFHIYKLVKSTKPVVKELNWTTPTN